MASVSLRDWLPFIETYTGSAPTQNVLRSLVRALQELCQKTEYWRHIMDDVDIVAATTSTAETAGLYTLPVPPGARLAGIRYLEVQEKQLKEKGEKWLDRFYNLQWRGAGGGGSPYYYRPSPEAVRLVPAPNTASTDGMKGRLWLKPSINAGDVPDYLLEEEAVREAVGFGVQADLLKQKGMPWYDLRESLLAKAQFQVGMEEVRMKAERDDTEEIQVMNTVAFGGSYPDSSRGGTTL